MKKLSLLLAILLIVSFGVSATNPPAVDFTVETTVAVKNEMDVTKEDLNGATVWDDTNIFELYAISDANDLTNNEFAYLSIISNNSTGYEISMKVEAMEVKDTSNNSHYINYTISLTDGQNTTDVTTNNGIAVTESKIVTVNELTALTGKSYPLGIGVNATEFANAVSGNYVGTVTFEFAAK